jgi:competence protein ComEA
VPTSGPPGGVAPGGAAPGSAGGLININTASATELETLSGIGEVLAATIIEYRTQNGPFASVEDLLDVSGIGPATLDEIRDQVTV